MPGAFPLFIALVAFLTSASVGGLVSMLRSSATGGGRQVHLVGEVETFTEVLNPSISLSTFGCNSAAIFAFHGGKVICIITTETFGDLVASAQFTHYCSTLSFCC